MDFLTYTIFQPARKIKGNASDDGTGKRSPHICFQPIMQKVAK